MQPTATVLVYSDDSNTREQVRLATGRRPAAGRAPGGVRGVRDACRRPRRSWRRAASTSACWTARPCPTGGMGVCRQIKDEIFNCPPVLLLIGRPQDAWLATWSRADAAVTLPVDPVEFAAALASLLRQQAADG